MLGRFPRETPPKNTTTTNHNKHKTPTTQNKHKKQNTTAPQNQNTQQTHSIQVYIGCHGTCPYCNLPQINKTHPPYPCNSARQRVPLPCFSVCGLLGVSLSPKNFLSPPLRSGSCAGFCCTCLLFASVFTILAPQAPEGLVCGAPVAGALRYSPADCDQRRAALWKPAFVGLVFLSGCVFVVCW